MSLTNPPAGGTHLHRMSSLPPVSTSPAWPHPPGITMSCSSQRKALLAPGMSRGSSAHPPVPRLSNLTLRIPELNDPMLKSVFSPKTMSPEGEGSGSDSSQHKTWHRGSKCGSLWKERREGEGQNSKAHTFSSDPQLLLRGSRSGDKSPRFYTQFDLFPQLSASLPLPPSSIHWCSPLPRAATPPCHPCHTAYSSQEPSCHPTPMRAQVSVRDLPTRPLALNRRQSLDHRSAGEGLGHLALP